MSERLRESPCSRMDLPREERWFARQAGEGKMISCLNMGLGNGVFEDILGQECHFCIRPYKKSKSWIKSSQLCGILAVPAAFRGPGLEISVRAYEPSGFYSGDGERPAEPPEDRQGRRKNACCRSPRVRNSACSHGPVLSAFSVLLLSYVLWDSRYRYCMERGAAPGAVAAVYGIALLTVFRVYDGLPGAAPTSRCADAAPRGYKAPSALYSGTGGPPSRCAVRRWLRCRCWSPGFQDGGIPSACGLTMAMAPVNLILRYV